VQAVRLPGWAREALIVSAGIVVMLVVSILAIRINHIGPWYETSTVEYPNSWTRLSARARSLGNASRGSQALITADSALRLALDSVGPEHPDVAGCMEVKAGCLYFVGRVAESESLIRSALEMRERVQESGAGIVSDLEKLGQLAGQQGRFAEADSLYWEAYARAGTDSLAMPTGAYTLQRIAFLHLAQGRYELAESLLLRTVRELRDDGDELESMPVVQESLAKVYDRQGRSAKADSVRRQIVRIRR
jgi:tetratricopeptide (TPR) repeat protein